MTRASALFALWLLGCASAAPRPSTPARWRPGPATAETPEASLSDRDGDGVNDADDLCPELPEDADGDRDEDGCPESPEPASARDPVDLAVVRSASGVDIEAGTLDDPFVTTLERSGALVFGPHQPRPVGSDETLDLLASRIRNCLPERRFVVLGHTDVSESGDPSLSLVRAQVVAAALVARGVAPERLQAVGVGSRCPGIPTRSVRVLESTRTQPWMCPEALRAQPTRR